MKTIALTLFILLIPCVANAEWTERDTAREVTWQIINFVDWGQSLDMTGRYDEGYYEKNPITRAFIGEHPSRGKINTFMALNAVAHGAVSVVLPDKYRPYWQYFTIGVSGTAVINNYKIGLRVNF